MAIQKLNVNNQLSSLRNNIEANVRHASRGSYSAGMYGSVFARTSLFHTGNSSMGVNYGIGAQRTLTNTGAIYHPRAFANTWMEGARQSLNAGVHFVSTDPMIMPQHVHNHNHKASFGDYMMGGMYAATSVLGMLNQAGVIGTKNTSHAGNPNGTGNGNGVGNADNTPASVSAMRNANDSVTLSAALVSAQTEQKTAIPQKIQTAEGTLTILKNNTAELSKAKENTQKVYDTNLKDIKTLSQDLNTANREVEGYQTAYDSLQSQYDSAKPEDKNGLKMRLNEAYEKLQTAKTKAREIEQMLNEEKGKTEGLKQAAADADEAYNKNLKDIEDTQNEIEQLKKQQADLDKEIPKQEKRLQELAKKESEELAGLGSKITSKQSAYDALLNSINTSDGLSKKEIKDKEKADKLQDELEGLKKRKAELEKREAMRKLPAETHNGTQFKTGFMPDGSTIYLVGGQEKTEAEYNAALEEAKKTEGA